MQFHDKYQVWSLFRLLDRIFLMKIEMWTLCLRTPNLYVTGSLWGRFKISNPQVRIYFFPSSDSLLWVYDVRPMGSTPGLELVVMEEEEDAEEEEKVEEE